MLPKIPFHLRNILRALGAVRIMFILALDIHATRIRDIHILIASIITRRPIDELLPIPALPGLEALVAVAESFGREFEPRGVVRVAVDILQEAVEAVLDVVIEVFFLRGASLGC